MRVSTGVLDRFLSTVGEVILSSNQLRTSARVDGLSQAPGVAKGLDRMDRVVGELQRRALDLRTTALQRIVEPLPRMAREIARRAGKRVEVEIRNAELELDRSILDRLSDPLVHLVRNAVDHGIEAPDARRTAGKDPVGRVIIEARRERDTIHVAVSDDGAGIDLEEVRRKAVESGALLADLAPDLPLEELVAYVFHAGLSTAKNITDISGRGVGMDAVRATLESLGGQVELTTERGRGTVTTLVVPITAAVQRVLLVRQSGETLAIPIARVVRVIEVPTSHIEQSGSEAFALIDGDPIPVLDLAERVCLRRAGDVSASATLVIANVRGERMALRVDAITGQQQIYVKPVPEILLGLRALTGLTLLGDGRPVFLLDLNQLP